MANNSVFREKSLKRLSSPEKLDDYIKVSNPSVWVIILALFLLLGGFSYWCIVGTLPTTIKGNAVSVSSGSSDIVDTALCFISQEDYSKLASAVNNSNKDISTMQVKVTPNGISSKYGYINGKISSIGSGALSTDAIASQIGDNAIAQDITPSMGYGIPVEITLDRDSNYPKRLSWSGDNSDGSAVLLEDTICEVSIVIQEDTPISFLFG